MYFSVICRLESPAYQKSSRRWCCINCGRTGRLAPSTTLWRNMWTTSPSKTLWGRRETRSWNMWQMAWYFWTAGRFRSARPQSPCAGWPASSQVQNITRSNLKFSPSSPEPTAAIWCRWQSDPQVCATSYAGGVLWRCILAISWNLRVELHLKHTVLLFYNSGAARGHVSSSRSWSVQ